MSIGADYVTISDRGGTNKKRLALSAIQCSWALNDLGSLSGFATLDALRRAGLGGDLKGKWIEYADRSGLQWGGVIQARPVTDGVAEVSALGWAVLLRGRALMRRARPSMAPPGALARKILQESSREEPHFLSIGQIDESGAPLLLTWGGEDSLEALPALIADGSMDWTVTFARQFRFGKLGTDRSATVRLVEGRHIASGYRIADDQWLVENRLVGIGAGRDGLESMRKGKRKRRKKRTIRDSDEFLSAVVEDVTSIRAYGPMEGIRDYSDTRDVETIRQRLRRELVRTAFPPVPVSLTLVETDHCFGWFAEGDTVRVELAGAGVTGTLRVMVRSLNTTTRTLEIGGDLTLVAAAAGVPIVLPAVGAPLYVVDILGNPIVDSFGNPIVI